MTVDLIASNDVLMAALRQSVQQAGLPLAGTCLRRPDEPLPPLMRSMKSGSLLLDICASRMAEDLQALETLTQERPQLNVIALSENQSKELLLQAMRAGVREVLPLPLNSEELTRSLLRWTADARPPLPASASPQGQTMAFIGCKGGSGTTFVAANLAYIMATEFDRQCVLMDLDLQCGDASFYLSSGSSSNNLSDLTRQINRLDAQLLSSCLHTVTPSLHLLCAPEDPQSVMTITAQDIEHVIDLAQKSHEQVLIDLPRTLDAVSLKALDMADVICIVMQSTTPDVRDAQRLVKVLRALGITPQKMRLVVNRHTPEDWVELQDIEKSTGLKVQYTLPDDEHRARQSMHLGKPLPVVNAHNALLQALRSTAADLLQVRPKRGLGWISRWMGKAA